MKATEQLDAMKVLRLDPIRCLSDLQELVACTITLPILVISGEFLAFLRIAASPWRFR